ncbi:MAG: hypothetical protein NVS9B12_08850 [Vulcanimicrobiaceae bacterium]
MFAKPALMLACLAALSTGIVRAADAPPADAATTAALTTLYATGCTAALDPTDKNVEAMLATWSPDFVAVDPKGKEMKRDEVAGSMKAQLKTFHGTECKSTFDSLKSPDATTAVVVATLHVAGDIQAPDGKHELDLTQKSEDTWKLAGGAWLQTKQKTLHAVVKIDGSVVQDQGQ